MRKPVLLCLAAAVLAAPGPAPRAAAQTPAAGAERITVVAVTGEADEARRTPATSGPLRLETVLDASAAQFPAILESLANRRAAEGAVLASEGAFDLVFSADGYDRVTGFWTGRIVNTEVRRNLRPLGATVYGGYRVSDGTFPIYEDINFTNTGGEAKIGALFSLLRNRNIDKRRFNEIDAQLGLAQADFDVLLTRIGVQRRALIAYWRWVAAGQQLKIYEELLSIAEDRQSGLEEQVRRGARAAIFLTENQQNITRRQRLTVEARRDFQAAANTLSFYYRGADGQPVIPSPSQLPPMPSAERFAAILDAAESGPDAPISSALARRPELAILRTAIERAQAETALRKNDLRPQLDVNAEVSRDFGEVAEGGISRDSTDTIVGLRFSVPLQRREARGRLTAARAAEEAARQRERQAEDQIELEVRNILIDLNVSKQLARLAELEVEQTTAMQNAERERFNSGASDFFLVNVREETAADARIRYVLAALTLLEAQANYNAATVNLSGLGISG